MAIAGYMEGWEIYRREARRKEDPGVLPWWGWGQSGEKGHGIHGKAAFIHDCSTEQQLPL